MLWINIQKFIFFLCSLHGITTTFGSRGFSRFWVLFLTVWNNNLLRFLSLDCVTADPGRNAFLFLTSTQSSVARQAARESHAPIKASGATFTRRRVEAHEAAVSSSIWLSDVSHLFWPFLGGISTFDQLLRGTSPWQVLSIWFVLWFLVEIHFGYQLFLVCC